MQILDNMGAILFKNVIRGFIKNVYALCMNSL